MEDYEDLAFEPEMTWNQLCDYASSTGAMDYFDIQNGVSEFEFRGVKFNELGTIKTKNGLLARNKSFNKMKAFIDVLRD